MMHKKHMLLVFFLLLVYGQGRVNTNLWPFWNPIASTMLFKVYSWDQWQQQHHWELVRHADSQSSPRPARPGTAFFLTFIKCILFCFYFFLKCSWFTMLCSFHIYSKLIQVIYFFFPCLDSFSILLQDI